MKNKYLIFTILIAVTTNCFAEDEEELARNAVNPFGKMIKIPFQYNYSRDIGKTHGNKTYIKFEPVVPVSLNENWNLISHSKIHFIDERNVNHHHSHQSGISDFKQHLLLSPNKISPEGFNWGLGPVFSIPTASYHTLGTQKWSIGPSSGLYWRDDHWTIGSLFYHLWSIAGSEERIYINKTYLKPRITYSTYQGWNFSTASDAVYNWRSDEWAAPVNFDISKLLCIGEQYITIGGGIRYWLVTTDRSPHGYAYRFAIAFLFPQE
ncbi:MAG: transporter [Candidatus Berkiellales bacterium]